MALKQFENILKNGVHITCMTPHHLHCVYQSGDCMLLRYALLPLPAYIRDMFSSDSTWSESAVKSNIGQALEMADSSTDEDLRAELAKLRTELLRERQRRAAAEQQMIQLRRESTRTQIRVEEEEEAKTNRLIKRLSELKLEKEQIARASECDSEYIINSLTQRLEELKKQKHDIIAAAEAENEFVVNILNKELGTLRVEKNELEKKVQRLSRSNTPGGGTPGSSPALSLSSGGGLSRAGSYRLPRASLTDSQDRLAQFSPRGGGWRNACWLELHLST